MSQVLKMSHQWGQLDASLSYLSISVRWWPKWQYCSTCDRLCTWESITCQGLRKGPLVALWLGSWIVLLCGFSWKWLVTRYKSLANTNHSYKYRSDCICDSISMDVNITTSLYHCQPCTLFRWYDNDNHSDNDSNTCSDTSNDNVVGPLPLSEGHPAMVVAVPNTIPLCSLQSRKDAVE